MKSFVLIAAAFVVLADAKACTPPIERRGEIDPVSAYENEPPPTVPVARVVRIERGRPAARGESTCVEMSYVTIAVRDDAPRLPFYFEFREVAGTAPDQIFQAGLYAGDYNASLERIFTFYWLEISRARAPLDLQVEITPFTRSGIRGPSSALTVSDRDN